MKYIELTIHTEHEGKTVAFTVLMDGYNTITSDKGDYAEVVMRAKRAQLGMLQYRVNKAMDELRD